MTTPKALATPQSMHASKKRHPTVGVRRHASVGVHAEGARIVPPMRTAQDAHNPLEGFRVSGLEEGAAT
eukprot:3819703-Prymnesium_polylepis.1